MHQGGRVTVADDGVLGYLRISMPTLWIEARPNIAPISRPPMTGEIIGGGSRIVVLMSYARPAGRLAPRAGAIRAASAPCPCLFSARFTLRASS